MKTALAAAVGLVVLGGCASAPDRPPTTAPATPTTTQTEANGVDCEDAPEEVVGQALELRLSHPRQTVDGSVVLCQYEGGGVQTAVRFDTASNAAKFAEGKQAAGEGQRVKDVTGFHDEAYTASLGAGEVVQNTVVARKGGVEVSVTSGANFERGKKLITELLGRL